VQYSKNFLEQLRRKNELLSMYSKQWKGTTGIAMQSDVPERPQETQEVMREQNQSTL
jgi:hypothetical protein